MKDILIYQDGDFKRGERINLKLECTEYAYLTFLLRNLKVRMLSCGSALSLIQSKSNEYEHFFFSKMIDKRFFKNITIVKELLESPFDNQKIVIINIFYNSY